ncbi:hypothetical protein D9757_006372 [Collybiopsis confluens]|uniref:ER membrane protein complex subunit 7 beta-sandwich domain-containing protein n=1 Tax=Collybiopsis confluens TaxID=2823264 RepID=A0A8H5HH92_9AGAR|nr:hypothetical protein D9757_006372 [Collybiopsis confluens]
MVLLFVLLGFLSLVKAGTDIKGRIVWNDVCRGELQLFSRSNRVVERANSPGYNELGHSRAVLDNGDWSGGILRNGSFLIPNVPAGTYLFSIVSHDYLFDQLRVDVSDSEVEAHPYIPGTAMNPASTLALSYPLKLSARQKSNYFVPVESFNIMGMLKNPMILMMIFAGGLVLGMPYLMKNLDPESLEDFKKEQVKISHAQSALTSGDFKSGFSALMAAASGQDQPSQQGSVQAPRAQAGKGRGRGKRR